jgi:hypothetical protein
MSLAGILKDAVLAVVLFILGLNVMRGALKLEGSTRIIMISLGILFVLGGVFYYRKT